MNEEITEQEIQEKACFVPGCTYPDQHLTAAHRCSNCWNYGHDKDHCQDQDIKAELDKILIRQIRYYDLLIPADFRCTIPGCKHPYSHHKSSHHCKYCGLRNDHITSNCHYMRDGLPPPPHPRKAIHYDPDDDHYEYSDDDDEEEYNHHEEAIDLLMGEGDYPDIDYYDQDEHKNQEQKDEIKYKCPILSLLLYHSLSKNTIKNYLYLKN